MNLTLSWDLFIVVFFAVIITYTFIIGKGESVKVLVSSYIGIVAVQAIGNMIERYGPMLNFVWNMVGFSMTPEIVSVIKLFLFISLILFLAVRGGITVVYKREESSIINGILTGLFGFATAGLLISTLLTYVASVPLLDAKLAEAASLSPIIQQSQLMQIMIFNQDIWFAVPALLLVIVGFIDNR